MSANVAILRQPRSHIKTMSTESGEFQEMTLILSDDDFYDSLRFEVGSSIRLNGPGKISAEEGFFEHNFDERRSNHLWSAFHNIRFGLALDGDVCRSNGLLKFVGDVEIEFEDNWDFSNPENDHRMPFHNYEFLPERLRRMTEGRFRRLESAGRVTPFLAHGLYASPGTAAVEEQGLPAASISLDRMPPLRVR